MAKQTAYEKSKARIKAMPEAEFEIYCRAAWRKWEASITNGEDSIPYYEYYSEMCANYDRTNPLNF